MKLSEIQEINGKKLTTPQRNLLAKLENEYDLKISGDFPQARVNIFSGATSAPLHPALCVLIDFVYNCETGLHPTTYNGKRVGTLFDRARFMVLDFDSTAYGQLLD